MKKIIAFVFILLFALTACGAQPKTADAPLTEILDEILTETGITGQIPVDVTNLTALYGISGDDIAESACCITMNGIFPDEILMIKAVDDAAAARIKTSLETRLAEVMNQSKSYDPASYAVAQKCRITENGLYISLFVSAKHEQMNELYGTHFK